jgi:hypothetical protein
MSKHGKFSGEPTTLWLTESGEDRKMRVCERFAFCDPDGKTWETPVDYVVDGASILRSFWSLLGSPYTGDYRRASIVHDFACDHAKTWSARLAADRMFYHACREGGCSIEQATFLYIGVRIGAWLPKIEQWSAGSAGKTTGPRIQPDPVDSVLVSDLQRLTDLIVAPGLTDDPQELEGRTERALKSLARFYAGG